ncbi:sugar diacid recognition domain-containing protein [Oscillospiraceae bacterium PP1C4]
MKLSVKNAFQIVNEISAIVNQNINMMDHTGTIIASTNPERIGKFHPCAKQIIDQNLEELYVDESMESHLMRKGLNLSIVFNGEVVGVIGITGEYDQVIKYGQIVKKMTEILLIDADHKNQKLSQQKAHDRYINEWVRGSGSSDDRKFTDRGLELGIDIRIPRRVMIVSVQDLQHSVPSETQKQIDKAEKLIKDIICEWHDNLIFRTTNKSICLVTTKSNSQIHSIAQRMCSEVTKQTSMGILVGIDGQTDKPRNNMHTAYNEALKAWKACLGGHSSVMLYDDITMEVFMGDVSTLSKEEYLFKIFKGFSFEEMRYWITILEAYFVAEGSISQAAQALYIHKNTLQYKLNKLQEKTGYDVRMPSCTAMLYLATWFFKDVENDMT